MIEELEKTCENCEYEHEDIEGSHCRHCIHNAEEHFEPKTIRKKEKVIRNKAIEEFADRMISMMPGHRDDILNVAKQLKGGANNG